MKTTISPIVILRIPAFSITDQLVEVWEELKIAISFSSSSFYEKIKTVKAHELTALDPKAQFTIWKYFNRSKYRGTPYGSFAGFAVAELTADAKEVVFSQKQHLHRFKDWSYRNDIQASIEDLTSADRLYFSNSSTYSTSRNIRFISLQEQVFELAEIEKSAFITELLDFCSKKATYAAIYDFAAESAVSEEVLTGILKAMLDLQLLFTDLNPNIIGPDYFGRNKQALIDTEEQYLIAERKVFSGGVDKAALAHLPSCIDYLTTINYSTENQGLKSFSIEFQRRFESQELPLMMVLDPELGIGYGDFAGTAATGDLANELSESIGSTAPTQAHPGAFAWSLLKEMLNGDNKQVITLEKVKNNPQSHSKISPANSFSALARFADDLVILEQIGGCTGNALAGRFTMASEAVELHCKQIATAESAANPEVIFFDLGYMAEGRVDNVNRRKGIYEYELPILNYSCAKELISLNDLLVTVKNGEIILLSAKYGKRLVPRLASAYNYSRSDLSVYRFLCDLQHQQLQTQILFDIQSLLPGLDFYPRVQYKNLVLSTAKWRIKASDLGQEPILSLLNKMGVSRYFSAGNGDQTLCFDRENETDLFHFKHYLNQYNDFVISECIITSNQRFKDEFKKNYFSQILLTLNHQELLYSGHTPIKKAKHKDIEGVIVPGKDWLYFEIYCHEERTDFILAALIGKFIESYSRNFKTWFFIRYNDPAPHLRLRLQLNQEEDGYFYISRLMEILDEDLSDGIITDVQLKTYHRETERYGTAQMALTERHFTADSNYALSLIENNPDLFHKYASCIALMKTVLGTLDLNQGDKTLFIRNIQQSFEKEHRMTSTEFKKVNREWSLFLEAYPFGSLDHVLHTIPNELIQSFNFTLAETAPEKRKALFCSLFHMHINRLFARQPRAHETIIYSFLYKLLQLEKQNLHLVKLDR